MFIAWVSIRTSGNLHNQGLDLVILFIDVIAETSGGNVSFFASLDMFLSAYLSIQHDEDVGLDG